jgi:hypothetical protein
MGEQVNSQGLRKSVRSASVLPPSVRRVPTPSRSWWPAVLGGSLDPEKIHGAGLELYVVVAPDTPSTREVMLFAIDWPNGRGFFYRTREQS